MTLIRRTVLLAAAAAVACGLGSAATLTYNFGGPMAGGFAPTDFDAQMVTTAFDSRLGTLTSIEIDFSSQVKTTLTAINQAGTASSGSAQSEYQFAVNDANSFDTSGGGGTVLAYGPGGNFGAAGGQVGDDLSNSITYSLGAGKQTTSSPSPNPFTTAQYSDIFDNTVTGWTAIASEFSVSGSGLASLWAKSLTTTDITNTGGATEAIQTTLADVTASITYTYNPGPAPTPEPATMILMGSALVGIGALRKKFAK